MVSINESYRIDIIGDWTIERVETDLPGFSEDEVDDPPEVWQFTHPDVELVGEILLGTETPQTAPRPLIVLEPMTEEALPELSSQYGDAYLVEGLCQSAGQAPRPSWPGKTPRRARRQAPQPDRAHRNRRTAP